MPSLPPCAAAQAICPPADKSANLQEKFVYCIVSTETEEEGHHADAEKRQGRPQPGIDQGRVAGRGYHGPQSGDPRQSAGRERRLRLPHARGRLSTKPQQQGMGARHAAGAPVPRARRHHGGRRSGIALLAGQPQRRPARETAGVAHPGGGPHQDGGLCGRLSRSRLKRVRRKVWCGEWWKTSSAPPRASWSIPWKSTTSWRPCWKRTSRLIPSTRTICTICSKRRSAIIRRRRSARAFAVPRPTTACSTHRKTSAPRSPSLPTGASNSFATRRTPCCRARKSGSLCSPPATPLSASWI